MLIIFAGYAIAKVKNKYAFIALLAIVNCVSVARCIDLNKTLSQTDTRVVVANFINQNIPNNSSIAVIAGQYSLPNISWDENYLLGKVLQFSQSINPLKAEVYAAMNNHYKKTNKRYERILSNGTNFKNLNTEIKKPDYIIQAFGIYEKGPTTAEQNILNENYKLIKLIRPTTKTKVNIYDPTDAFYIPLKGKTSNPGPDFLIYSKQ
jgi:hypothetical protein